MNKKNPIVAFLLAFFPGVGLFYLGKPLRGLFYMAAVFGLPIVSFGLVQITWNDFFIIFAIGGLLLYIVNFVDTAITASRLYHVGTEHGSTVPGEKTPESERFFALVLSFVPGLGHFQLGLMNRGMTILSAFLGLGIMVMFITFLSHRGEFIVFMALLPLIWVYSFFDITQQLARKQRGEPLVDRSILEDFETRREQGKKSKSIATFLSIFPGAGHLYLGLQKRGIQLMAAFLFAIYILDVLRLGIFLFLIPIIWFYSFFDGMQRASRYGREPIEDTPIISSFINHQRWIGIGLILLGLYYLVSSIVLPILSPVLHRMIHIDLSFWFNQYFQTTFLCILLIAGGIKLMSGSKQRAREEGEE